MTFQTFTIRELADIEKVQVMTIRNRIQKWYYIPAIFRKWRKERTETVRYLSYEASTIIRNMADKDILVKLETREKNNVSVLEKARNS
jgi:hypothetical protein